MEKRPVSPMTQLDTLVTTQELQLMKLMLPYVPVSWRGMLAIYIKFTELSRTLQLFRHPGPSPHSGPIPSKDLNSPGDILQDLQIFMDPAQFDQMQTLFNMMQMMDQMDPSDLSPSGNAGEMTEMMHIFDDILKGNDTHE